MMIPKKSISSLLSRGLLQRRVVFAVCCLISLLGCASATPDAVQFTAVATVQFDKQAFLVDGPGKHTVFSGFFKANGFAQIGSIHIDKSKQRRLQMYSLTGANWSRTLDTRLGSGVKFIDFATINGRERLLTYSRGRLNWFDPESMTERLLVLVSVDIKIESRHTIPRVDISKDLNRDGLDDIVIPSPDGFWIALQLADGSFGQLNRFGPPEPYRDKVLVDRDQRYGAIGITAQTIPWYLSRIHAFDHDLDGRSDLVFWQHDHFNVHRQTDSGEFEPVAETFTVKVPFDSEGIYSFLFSFEGESDFALMTGFRKQSSLTMLHSFRDLNSDGLMDLITLTLQGRSVFEQQSHYRVHFGAVGENGIIFTEQAGFNIKPNGKSGAGLSAGYARLAFLDLDADGDTDIVHGNVNFGLSKILRAMLANSITIDLELFRFGQRGFTEQPNDIRYIRPKLDFFSGRGPFFPVVQFGDVSGDGRVDLIIGAKWDELSVYVGGVGSGIFADTPQQVAVNLPSDEKYVWLMDINRDSKQDILVFRYLDGDQNNVTVLMSQ